jgi:hypothetical protein
MNEWSDLESLVTLLAEVGDPAAAALRARIDSLCPPELKDADEAVATPGPSA